MINHRMIGSKKTENLECVPFYFIFLGKDDKYQIGRFLYSIF